MVNVQLKALALLLENGVSSLPINTEQLQRKEKPWFIGTYNEWKELIHKLNLEDECTKYNAFSIKTTNEDNYIFYNDNVSAGERNFLIGHEIGHIDLDHNSVGLVLGKSNDANEEAMQEQEANVYALYLTAPTCILANADITSIREIVGYTSLAEHYARNISYEISQLKSFIVMEEERKLCWQFKGYIFKRRLWKYSKYGIIVLLILATLILSYFTTSYMRSAPPEIIPAIMPAQTPVPTPTQITTQPPSVEPAQTSITLQDDSIPLETKVYVTPSGQKFHKESCRYIDKDTAKEMAIEKALHDGYGACKVCKPLED